ncbi:MAG TPA: hypothetical protein VFK47_10790, partial [Ktedonobacteraceae bacterium]|nr:hypothetical protein [Ktedonobacteraceae bacterium]
MTFFLLMLLAGISLIITLVGYLLTARPQTREPGPRAAYQTDSYVNHPRRRVRQPLELETPRYLTYVEQRSVWTDNWQSLLPRRILRRRAGEPTPWMGITLVLISVFLLGIFLLRAIMPNAILIGAMTWPSAPSTSAQPTPLPVGPYTASRDLVRVSQLDPAQYNSNQEYNTWAYSACSAAAMTEVINAYGHRYRVTDILKVEAAIGEITPQMGLLEDIGIQRTAARFGFNTVWGHKLALNDVID